MDRDFNTEGRRLRLAKKSVSLHLSLFLFEKWPPASWWEDPDPFAYYRLSMYSRAARNRMVHGPASFWSRPLGRVVLELMPETLRRLPVEAELDFAAGADRCTDETG